MMRLTSVGPRVIEAGTQPSWLPGPASCGGCQPGQVPVQLAAQPKVSRAGDGPWLSGLGMANGSMGLSPKAGTNLLVGR